jgi:alkylated DNA repair dioxygenase AlkB
VNPSQLSLFEPERSVPSGFRYRAELLSPDEEAALIDRFAALPLEPFAVQGFTGKRRVMSFGWQFDFDRREIRRTKDMPDWLLPMQARAAAFADLAPADLRHVLLTEYPPGAAIGWHKDKIAFGDVVGISLLSPCVFRLRRPKSQGWERFSLVAEPRSIYLLRGEARTLWEHSISAVNNRRWSVTFRTLKAT